MKLEITGLRLDEAADQEKGVEPEKRKRKKKTGGGGPRGNQGGYSETGSAGETGGVVGNGAGNGAGE